MAVQGKLRWCISEDAGAWTRVTNLGNDMEGVTTKECLDEWMSIDLLSTQIP